MASKFRESPHSRRRGLQTPPHLHLGESGQSGLERETGAVRVVIGLSGDRTGPPATRAKALNLYTGAFMRVENPLPRTKSPALAQLRRFVSLNAPKKSSDRQFRTPKYLETPAPRIIPPPTHKPTST